MEPKPQETVELSKGSAVLRTLFGRGERKPQGNPEARARRRSSRMSCSVTVRRNLLSQKGQGIRGSSCVPYVTSELLDLAPNQEGKKGWPTWTTMNHWAECTEMVAQGRIELATP